MVETLPPRRRVYGRDHASARTPNDRERRIQARREAEALFVPKLPLTERPVALSAELARVSPAAPAPRETIEAPIHPERMPARTIPAAHIARIRTWVRYGMTIDQVAAVYGVEAGEIARLLGKA
jgi:hypothetical protein